MALTVVIGAAVIKSCDDYGRYDDDSQRDDRA